MLRTSGRLVVLMGVLWFQGGWVASSAAAPRPTKPVWTLSQDTDEFDQQRVTLKGVIPADARANYSFSIGSWLGNQCGFTWDCTWWPTSPMQVDQFNPKQAQYGTGWTLTAEQSRSGLTVTLALDAAFLVGRRYLGLHVVGVPSAGSYPSINVATSVNEQFGAGWNGSGAAVEALHLLKGTSADAERLALKPKTQPPVTAVARREGGPIEALSLGTLLLIGLVSWRRR